MNDLSGVKAFEDKRWTEQDQELVWRHSAALQLVQTEPVLDVGGGDGLFLKLLQGRGFSELKLLDVSPVAVRKARASGFEADCADITKPLPFPDDYFGTICALDVLEHLYDPLSTLKEMRRVSREIVLVVPNFHYWKDRLHMTIGRVPFQCKPRRGHVHWFNYPILKGIVDEAGLTIGEVVFGGFLRLGPVGGWLARRRPNLFATSFAVRLVK